ncbi:hypothetical protein ES332_A06G169400v1 [Gossypium tomentosum]|uniref:BSD2 cysteine rich domain-containing protein n=1 Tax=Gossypium tomentosum TaxID=34277 RepID=A0A5D2Q5G1_GOSTO|nr:hypothetical protein ES332_A06G169400v1 [Gossypium tomentosum]
MQHSTLWLLKRIKVLNQLASFVLIVKEMVMKILGAKQCSQCKGTGVNSVDHFNGQFKASELCWLCNCRNWHILGSKESTKVIQGYRQW